MSFGLRRIAFLALASSVAACSGQVTPTDGGRDSSHVDDRWISPDAGSDAADDDATDAGNDAIADVGTDAPRGTCETSPVQDVPSRQSVTFHFAAGASGYLVTSGIECSALGIARLDPAGEQNVALGLAFQCVCECPRPPDPHVLAAHSLTSSSGTSPPTLAWDARELVTCTRPWDCNMHGWPGGGIQLVREGAMVPVSEGRYRATFAMLDTLPTGCTTSSDGSVSCPMQFGPGVPMFPRTYELCPAMRTVSVEFDLPANGSIDVAVP